MTGEKQETCYTEIARGQHLNVQAKPARLCAFLSLET